MHTKQCTYRCKYESSTGHCTLTTALYRKNKKCTLHCALPHSRVQMCPSVRRSLWSIQHLYTNYPSWNVLSLHSSSLATVPSPVWEGYGGIELNSKYGEECQWEKLENWLTQVHLEGLSLTGVEQFWPDALTDTTSQQESKLCCRPQKGAAFIFTITWQI